MTLHHYIMPSSVLILDHGMVPVRRFIAHPPGTHHGPIRPDLWAVESITDHGSRWDGGTNAYIDASLRMVIVADYERDEVRRKWKKIPNPRGTYTNTRNER